MEDKNEGYTNTEVVEQQGRVNAVHTKEGPTNLVRHLNTEVANVPPNQQLDVPQFGDVGNKMFTQGVNELAKSISGIAEVSREGWRKETVNKLALKASAAQGTDIAINSIAATKKRDPFMAAVLGQTVTSRVAEAQSVQNATTALYNTASEEMPQLAGLPTEEAMEVLATRGEEFVAQIQDPEMRQVALDNLMSHMPKLAQQHHKERYALMRNKQVQNNRESIINSRIMFENTKKIAVLPEEKIALMVGYAKSIYDVNDPTGMQQDDVSKKEFRTLVHTQAATDLRNGNKTLYDAIKGIPQGKPNALTSLEREGFREAETAYDRNRNTMAGQVVAAAELGLLAAATPEETDAAIQIAKQDLKTWSLSGTQSELDIKNKTVRKVQMEKLFARHKGAWAKNQVDMERTDQLDNAHTLGDIAYTQLMGTATKAEKKYMSNIQLRDFITETSGMPKDQATEAGLNVFTTGLHFKDDDGSDRHMSGVTVAKQFVRSMRDSTGPVPDVVQNFVDTKMRGMTRGEGEDGKWYSQEQRNSFRVMEVLADMPGITMSTDEKVHLEFMRRGFNADESPEAIEAQFKNYQNNKGLQDQTQIPRKDRKENFRNLVTNLVGHKVSDRVITEYEDLYGHIAQSVGYDHKIAEAVFNKEVKQSSSVVQGLVVANGRKLNKELGGSYDLRELLSSMGTVTKESELGVSISIGTPVMMAMFGADRDSDQKTLTDTSRLRFSNIDFIPGDDSVEFTTIGGGVTRIPMSTLKSASKQLEVARKKAEFTMAVDKQMTLEGRETELHYMGPQAADIMRTVYDTGATTGIRSREPTKAESSWVVRKALSLFSQ